MVLTGSAPNLHTTSRLVILAILVWVVLHCYVVPFKITKSSSNRAIAAYRQAQFHHHRVVHVFKTAPKTTVWRHPASRNGSQVAILTTWSGPDTLQFEITDKLRREFGEKWGYDVHLYRDMQVDRNPHWHRLYAVRDAMQKNPQTKWFWLIDVDVAIMNPNISLEEHVFAPLSINTTSSANDGPALVISYDCNQLNTGSMFLRNCDNMEALRGLWLNPTLANWTFDEQDAISHIASKVSWASDLIVLAPPRMFNSYLLMTCPLDEVFNAKQRSQLDPAVLDRVVKVSGYDYGGDLTYGWELYDFENTNWLPTAQPTGNDFREITPAELQDRYRSYAQLKGLAYRPLVLSPPPSLEFPYLPPHYSAKYKNGWASQLSPQELRQLHVSYWSDNRVRDGRWHYRLGDLVIHTAGCGALNEDCSAIMQSIATTREEILNGELHGL